MVDNNGQIKWNTDERSELEAVMRALEFKLEMEKDAEQQNEPELNS